MKDTNFLGQKTPRTRIDTEVKAEKQDARIMIVGFRY